MTKKSFNNYGVPHYSPSDTPAIRSHPIRELPDAIKIQRGIYMQALKYMRDSIREEYKEGDKFTIFSDKLNVNREGVFVKLFLCGCYWKVRATFYDGLKVKGDNLIGISLFYHFAQKVK